MWLLILFTILCFSFMLAFGWLAWRLQHDINIYDKAITQLRYDFRHLVDSTTPEHSRKVRTARTHLGKDTRDIINIPNNKI